MKVETLSVGVYGANCYLIKTEGGKGVILDPGGEPERILAACRAERLTSALLLCTHGHFDHVTALTVLREQTGAPVCIHADDNPLLTDPALLGSRIPSVMPGYRPAPADRLLADGDKITVDEVTLQVFHTPGHSAGSCCFLTGDLLFTGDTLFADGVGRTDLFGGDPCALSKSLSVLSRLPDGLQVLPGHGPATTLFYEKTHNPYLRELG